MPSKSNQSWFNFYIQDTSEMIFNAIMEEEPQNQEEYEEKLDLLKHEIMDQEVCKTSKEDIEELVYVYGITKAIASYINQWGSLENIPQNSFGGREYSMSLLYNIVNDEINVSYEAYLAYYKDNHDEE